MSVSTPMPSIFVSQGLPPMALYDNPYNSSLADFGRSLPEGIKGIVCVSSHWISPGPILITNHNEGSVQHNFYGYQKEIYDLDYRPPGSEDLVQKIARLLEEENYEVGFSNQYGFDHGVWMPLRLIRPHADVPVIQISLPLFEDPRLVLKLGKTLSALRDDGVMLMASGAAALNPSKIVWHAQSGEVNPKIKAFDSWLWSNLMEANIENILNYKTTAPYSDFAHPSSANLLPIFFTIGSSQSGDRPQAIYKGFKYGSLSLLTFCMMKNKLEINILS
ncbi:MAG TPA: class III extradiol ring-cleavage dioxygenase [Bacteriovoracaceae bacterium]|nr:class III extradiol ring-cleavage dioxygenase [Bacteriovoracaceae bacterium]